MRLPIIMCLMLLILNPPQKASWKFVNGEVSNWVAGTGLDIHSRKREIGRFLLAGGSEGFRVLFSLGLPAHSNSRKDWQ